jgi:hypothetical protein
MMRVLQGNKAMTFGAAKLMAAGSVLAKSRALTTKILFVSLNSDLDNSYMRAFSCARETV